MRRTVTVVAAVLAAASCAAPALASPERPDEPTLEARATLPADASAPAPFAGAPNTDPAPQRGARQPVGGFSALIEGPRPRPLLGHARQRLRLEGQLTLVPAAPVRGGGELGDGAWLVRPGRDQRLDHAQ